MLLSPDYYRERLRPDGEPVNAKDAPKLAGRYPCCSAIQSAGSPRLYARPLHDKLAKETESVSDQIVRDVNGRAHDAVQMWNMMGIGAKYALALGSYIIVACLGFAPCAQAAPLFPSHLPSSHPCTVHAENDSLLPARIRAYLSGGMAPDHIGRTDPGGISGKQLRLIEACPLGGNAFAYDLKDSATRDVNGVCHFNSFELDPSIVGGPTIVPDISKRTFRTFMQIAASCPAQTDQNYVNVSMISSGIFIMLDKF